VAARFAAAFADGDVEGVVALLTGDAWLTMPPAMLEYQGPSAIAGFLRQVFAHRGGLGYRLVPTGANGQPAFGCYLQDNEVFRPHGMVVLTTQADRISVITRFPDHTSLAWFRLPEVLAG
jgi:RNA polymerase sigma-70 factor (ECF subfamily)